MWLALSLGKLKTVNQEFSNSPWLKSLCLTDSMQNHLFYSPMKSSAMDGNYVASSPLRLLREESLDANGTLSPISSRSNGTDTETDTKKKVSGIFKT